MFVIASCAGLAIQVAANYWISSNFNIMPERPYLLRMVMKLWKHAVFDIGHEIR